MFTKKLKTKKQSKKSVVFFVMCEINNAGICLYLALPNLKRITIIPKNSTTGVFGDCMPLLDQHKQS